MALTKHVLLGVLCFSLLLLSYASADSTVVKVKRFWTNNRQTSFLTNYPSLTPGQKSAPVEIWLANTGTNSWPSDAKVALLTNSNGWTANGYFLSTSSQETKPNSVAHFTGSLNAPSTVGIFTLLFQVVGSDIVQGSVLFSIQVESTCNDHVFCNGHEVWTNGTCVSSNSNPCAIEDPHDCVTATCTEETGLCSYQLDAGCETCIGCVPDCEARECGADGCGGVCGHCGAELSCVSGKCSATTSPGTCANPLPFFDSRDTIEGRHWKYGDTSVGVHHVTPQCNEGSTARELVYYIDIPEGKQYGMMAQYYDFDTVLEVREGSCDGESVACNDDAYPPGNYGSRVQLMLESGKRYYLILDAYNDENPGNFTFFADFVENCVPRCNSLYCGDNGCGGDCGPCGEGEMCSENNKCFAVDCKRNCTNRECGDDGCGGECGECTSPALCARGLGQCLTYSTCNHFNPVCSPGCGSNEYCGNDCQCYKIAEGLPDLILNTDKLADQVRIQTLEFASTDCAVKEGCITEAGIRRVLRFTVESVNQGKATLLLGDPALSPNRFTYSPCHGHYHFDGYTQYLLLKKDEPFENVVNGRKQGYCIYDGYRTLSGPSFECTTEQSCSAQGIQPGWVDNYGWSLDCQWVDITDVEPGDYYLFVEINFQRRLQESDYDNNKAYVSITIPPPETDASAAPTMSSWLADLFNL